MEGRSSALVRSEGCTRRVVMCIGFRGYRRLVRNTPRTIVSNRLGEVQAGLSPSRWRAARTRITLFIHCGINVPGAVVRYYYLAS